MLARAPHDRRWHSSPLLPFDPSARLHERRALSVAAAFVCALAHGCRRGPPATLGRFTTDALQARVDGMLRLPESPSRVAALIGSFPAIRDFFFDFQGTVGMTFRPLKTGSYAAQPKVGVDDDTPDVLCEVLRPREV